MLTWDPGLEVSALSTAGFKHCQSSLLVGTAIYSSLLEATKRSQWLTWPLGL